MIFTSCLFFLLALPLALASAIPRSHLVTRDTISSGQTYKITNAKSGTVVDLSAGDNTTSKLRRVESIFPLLTLFLFYSQSSDIPITMDPTRECVLSL